MADAEEVFRYGEARSLKVTLTPESGTIQLVNPVVTLRDGSNAIVGSINATACTSYQTGTQSAPWASYLFDTAAIWATEAAAVGYYVLTFMEPLSNDDRVATAIGIKVTRLNAP